MKIGIVTIVDYTNYGNRLQNYAMQHTLKKRFNVHADTVTAKKEKPFYDGNYKSWLNDQIARKFCIFPKIAERRWGSAVTRWTNFHKWTEKNIPTKTYYSQDALSADLNQKYDLFFAGSDQIWNYNFSSSKFDDFFLRFTDHKKRNAISASFGVEYIPEEWKQIYTDALSDFANISVREDAGAAIVKELTGREVPVLIDPTMMLDKDEWLKVSSRPRVDCSKPYVLKYYLGNEADSEKIDVWAKENGYEVYELLNDKIPELYSTGPGEFISLINNAALVCSDSFHCIVFSIIFSKPFLVYARRGSGNYMTSRLDTLLRKFDFSHRWKHLVSPEDYLDCDFSKVPQIIKTEQNKFEKYISKILNNN